MGGPTLDSFRMGTGHKKNQPSDERARLSAPAPDLRREGERWRLSSITNGQ